MTGTPPTRVAGPAPEETTGAGRAGARPGHRDERDERARQPAKPLGIVGWLRWCWRQLTSMRTALVLLFLLAVASVPGSMLPQNGADSAKVSQYISQHPVLGPILNKLSLFDVFAAPWFAAIYLLLFLSLAGCVLPRAFRLAVSARAQPPVAPRHPARLPFGSRYEISASPSDGLAATAALLREKRFRLRTGDDWISAEKGYLRETGNLIFHIALLALLAAIGLGALFGYKADVILTEGDGFANTVAAYDQYRPGRAVAPGDLQPFSVWLDRFHASYIPSGSLRGEPSSFAASIRYTEQPGAAVHHYDLQVNRPLNIDGAKVYLIGHGYAPVFRVTDGHGQVALEQAVPFLPAGGLGYTSEGVVKVPDARPEQLGFVGVFLPTAVDEGGQLDSAFPAPLNPAVSLVSYAGNLGLDSGLPQSVYQLDTAGMRRLPVAPRPLFAGQSIKLPDGAGSLTFTGYRQWISVQVTYDPGRFPALVSAIVAILGLLMSFLVRRRRLFVRVRPAGTAASGGGPAVTEVEFGGLARSDVAGGFEEEYTALAAELGSALGSQPAHVPREPEDASALPPSQSGGTPCVPGAASFRGYSPDSRGRRCPEPPMAHNPPQSATTSEDRK